MDPKHKELLTHNRVSILDNLHNADEVADLLFEKDVFTESMKDEVVQGNKIRRDKVRELLDILPKRGPKAFGIFLDVLDSSGNQFIVENLISKDPSIRGQMSKQQNIRSIQVEDDLPSTWPDETIDVLNMELIKCSDANSRQIQCSPHYEMTKRPRGRVLVINIMQFENSNLAYRNASDKDVKNIEKLFKQLLFDIEVRENLTAEDIRLAVQKESQNHIHEHCQCFVLFILTHGEKGSVFGSDGEAVEIKEITDYFDGRKCPALQNKPKLFFFQACQGDTRDWGAYSSSLPAEQERVLNKAIGVLTVSGDQVDANNEHGDPTCAHFFIAMSTTPEYVSYRNPVMGSWFVLAITYVFKKLAYKEDILSMMTLVNQLVSKGRANENGQQCMAVSTFRSTLTKKLYFLHGIPE